MGSAATCATLGSAHLLLLGRNHSDPDIRAVAKHIGSKRAKECPAGVGDNIGSTACDDAFRTAQASVGADILTQLLAPLVVEVHHAAGPPILFTLRLVSFRHLPVFPQVMDLLGMDDD